MKKIYFVLIILIITNFNNIIYSQSFFYTTKDTDNINLIYADSNHLYFLNLINHFIYKMDYNKAIIDSIFIPSYYYLLNKTIDYNNFLYILGYKNLNKDSIIIFKLKKDLSSRDVIKIKPNLSNYSINDFFFLGQNFYVFIDNYYYTTIYKINPHTLSKESNTINHMYISSFIFDSGSFYLLSDPHLIDGLTRILRIDTTLNIVDTMIFNNHQFLVTPNALGLRFNNKFFLAMTYYNDNQINSSYLSVKLMNDELDSVFCSNEVDISNDRYTIFSSIMYHNNYFYTINYKDYDPMVSLTCINSIWISNFDTLLNLRWRKILSMPNTNIHATKLHPAPNGGCVVGITFKEIGGPKFKSAIVYIDPDGNYITSLPNNMLSINEVSIYPNPSNDYLNIEIASDKKNYLIELFDSYGQRIQESYVKDSFMQIATSSLNPGLYFYRITHNGQVISKGKWIKQ